LKQLIDKNASQPTLQSPISGTNPLFKQMLLNLSADLEAEIGFNLET